ncbi:hypothetical protein HNP40_001041 [Mycobacteroides chelonae]|nr:hypothetical protein [Mycobacteroides chelonae]
MLLEPRLRAGIHGGTVSVACRRGKRPQVKVGGRYRVGSDRIRSTTGFDLIEVHTDALLAGYPSAAAARADVGATGSDPLYRLAFRKIDMADPRAELASSAKLSAAYIADIDARLGLTLSLPVGYRLSPRGAQYLARSSN